MAIDYRRMIETMGLAETLIRWFDENHWTQEDLAQLLATKNREVSFTHVLRGACEVVLKEPQLVRRYLIEAQKATTITSQLFSSGKILWQKGSVFETCFEGMEVSATPAAEVGIRQFAVNPNGTELLDAFAERQVISIPQFVAFVSANRDALRKTQHYFFLRDKEGKVWNARSDVRWYDPDWICFSGCDGGCLCDFAGERALIVCTS